MYKIIYTGELEKVAGKAVFGATMKALLAEDKDVVYLDADLMNSVGTGGLETQFPDQAFDVGIQEANMAGLAGGLAAVGKKPYIHTFGCFASRRMFDQVFISIAYAQLNARVIGSDPGVTAAYNGGTHMPFEDICLYRAIPNATVIETTDAAMAGAILRQTKDRPGVTYIRLSRKNLPAIYEPGSTFEIGKGNVLRDGKDVAFIVAGLLVAEALKAAEELEKEGISAAVIDMFTIKPLDEALTLEYAKKTGAIVTGENGNIVGGLGAAVAGFLSGNRPTPVVRTGVQDRFGQVGAQNFLQEEYGLTAKVLIENAKKAIALKG